MRQSSHDLAEEEIENILVIHKLKKWDFLKEMNKEKTSFIGGMTQELLVCKDFIVTILVVGFVEYPIIQLVPSMILFLLSVVILLKEKPFKSKTFFCMILVNEITYFIVLAVLLLYHFVGENMEL